MSEDNHNRVYTFYSAVLNRLEKIYPEFREQNASMLKVLHAFSDKPPLVQALLDKNLLMGVVLKKSSQEQQPEIANDIARLLIENDLNVSKSSTTYGNAIPMLSRKFGARPIILGDHGGYFSNVLPEIHQHFKGQLIGVTEHTLNGDVRHLRNSFYDIPFLSTARIDIKERSDREIAAGIAAEIIRSSYESGKDLLSPKCNEKILLIGYGVMGLHTANKLKELGCNAEIIVTDVSDKRMAFAVQDGFSLIRNIKDFLPEADIVVLATDVIKGKAPVLNAEDFTLMKSDVLLTSMTSMDDEVDFSALLEKQVLIKVGTEKETGIYKGPAGQNLQFMLDGRPANTALHDGGSGISICMVEAAGLAGAYYMAHCHTHGIKPERALPDDVVEMICNEWLGAFVPPAPILKFPNYDSL